MRAHQKRIATALALAAVLVVPNRTLAQDAEVVIEWNRILQATVTGTPTPTTGGAADITRPFNGLRELADQEARSRVYGGIHFEFDQLASFGVCTPLADYAVDNYLRARFPSR